jgi:O-antigen ligase
MLSILAFGTVEPWSIALFELNALLLAILISLRFVAASQPDWRSLRIALPVLALLLFAACQSIQYGSVAGSLPSEIFERTASIPRALSLDPNSTREATVKLLALLIYFVAAIHTLRDSRRRRLALIALTIFGVAVSIFAIAQRLTYDGKMYWIRPVSPFIAPYGPYGNYNHFAGMIELILPLPTAYALFARIDGEQRLVWLFGSAIMAAASILSLSRGGFFILAAQISAFAVIALVDRRAAKGNKIVLSLAPAAAAALVLWVGYGPLSQRFGKIRDGANEHSVATRLEYWSSSWRMFMDHPVCGVGLGAFPAIYPSYGRSSAKYERLEQAHSDYLQLLTDAGIIGGVIGLWFLFELIRIGRLQLANLARTTSMDRALIIGGYIAVCGLLLHSFWDFNLQIAANALLFLFVVALATAREKTPKTRNNFNDNDESSIARFSRAAPDHSRRGDGRRNARLR